MGPQRCVSPRLEDSTHAAESVLGSPAPPYWGWCFPHSCVANHARLSGLHPLSYRGIKAMLKRRSKARFSFALSRSGPMPSSPKGFSPIPHIRGCWPRCWGTAARVIEQHDDMASQIRASRKFCELAENGG